MDEEKFNATIRRFLKEVGVTSQREIEKAVRDALSAGRLQGDEKLAVKMTLQMDGVGLSHVVENRIELG